MKIPLFSIEPLIESYYIEQIGDKKITLKEYLTIGKSTKKLNKSIDDLIKWIFIEYNGKQYPVLLKKSMDNHAFLTGPLRLKKAKTEKDLEYWKKKLLDLLRMEKSLSAILYPGEVPELAEELLLKARGYPVGTVREWSGKKYKKLSSGKWMLAYEGTGGQGEGSGSRGEKQAIKNVIKKIQNASSMEEMLEIVRENKERFVDASGKALPVIAEFLKEAQKGEKESKSEEKPKKVTEEKKYKSKTLDIMAKWITGDSVRDMRNALRISDRTIAPNELSFKELKDANKYKDFNKFVDDNIETIHDAVLYRGTDNDDWLKVKPGDEIPTGMASFSKSEDTAKGFTGLAKIIIRYTPPPNAEGIDYQRLMDDRTLGVEWAVRSVALERYEDEKEVAIRSKALKVKKVSKITMRSEVWDKDFEYTVIDVGVIPVGMSKAIDNSELMNNLSNDFNNPLSKRDKEKKKEINPKEDKTIEYWKKKITHLLEGDLIEKSIGDILFPGIMIKSLPEDVQNMLIKARGFAPGTIRTWKGKEYKKMANGKWVRNYREIESRGAKQAIRNVRKKIMDATSMEELLEIVKQNSARFKDNLGKMLPIVREFIIAARATEVGAKEVEEEIKPEKVIIERKKMAINKTFEMDIEEADSIVDRLVPENDVMGYYYLEEEGDITFYQEVKKDNYIDNIPIDPYDLLEEPKEEPVDIQKDLSEKIVSIDFRSYGSWNPEGAHLKPAQRERLNRDIAELINKDFLTQEEKDTIRLYSGFGGTKVADEKGLLYDYYTSPPVAKMIFQAINKISPIKKNDKILEPAVGTGVFFDVAPAGVETVGIEYDTRTAKAADILQPESDIHTGSFEQFNLYSKKDFDIVIGNSPFGKRSVETSFIDSDTDANGKLLPGEDTLDRYFISKSLDNLKPGGSLGMIAYSGIMNNVTNTEWRKEMLRKGQFVGAMQLPNESFKHTQTGVSPDIYYFKKHSKEVLDKLKTATEEQLKESGAWNEEWVNGGYYEKYPENRLGKQGIGQFGAEITVGKVTDELLNNAVANFNPEIKDIDVSNLPKPVIEKPKDEIDVSREEAGAVQAKTLMVGSVKVINGITYVLNANHRWERLKGQEDMVDKVPVLTKISLKINEIRKAMQSDVNPTNLQNEVRDLLEEYKKEYGSYPNDDTKVTKMLKKNPALKSIHEAVNVTMESGILNNQNIYAKEIRIVDGHQPDIVALKDIQKNLAKGSPDTIRNMYPDDAEELMDMMLKNKDIFIDSTGDYQLREDFIAGDAWTKIDSIRNMMDGSDNKDKLQYGIDELEKAIGWVGIEDADIMPQSSWIPENIIQQWSEEEYNQTLYRRGDKWDSSGGYDKSLTYFMNFQKQRGGSKEENDIDTITYNQSAEDSFKNFVATHDDTRLIMEEMYNRKFNTELGVPNKTYTVNIEGWDKYTLDPWQWQSIHHLYEKGKGMSAMGTGFGKTLAGVALMALLRQEGKIKRPLFQVPNNKVKDWLRIINAAMPGLKVGAVDPESKGYSSRDVRYQMYQDLANNDYDVLILPETSASEIQLSEEEDAAITKDVILSQMPDLKTEKQREKAKESLRGHMISGKKNQTITFEDLGVDAIFVDEAHNYKNLFSSSLSRETGLNDGKRSERALSFYKKTEYIRKKHDGKNVFLLTATPLTNSPLEYYNMLSHIAPEEFTKLGISNINDFIKNFADIQQSDEVDWATNEIVNKKVLKGFKNLRSLQDMFFKYTDFQNDPNAIGIEKPESTKRPNILPQDDSQVSELKDLSAQLIAYKKKSKEDRDDSENTLTFFSKMRTASLDLELYDPFTYKGWVNPKLDLMAQHAIDISKTTGGGQVVFCDRVLSSDKTFNMHDKIKDELVKKGFKAEEIAIVNGITKSGAAQSDKALQIKVSEVQDGFNSGKYKILIGTTGTIGEGLNLQKNSAALHHIDIPYRPSDFIQRNGRIDRQGNKQNSVELHTYASAGTIDNYSIAKVSGKENWINTLLKTKSSVFTNPDGEGFDMDEMMISLQGEWGQDTAELKEKIKERKESKIKQRNVTAMNDTIKKLSTVRGSIESYTGEKGSRQYRNMLNKESVYTEALKGNPEFHNHELTNGERTPFMYDSRNKKVMKIGDYYSKGKTLYRVKNIDFKKGEVKFYMAKSPDYEGYDLPSWSIKRGFGGYGYQDSPEAMPDIRTKEDAAVYQKAVGGEFLTLDDQLKKQHYPDYIFAGDPAHSYSNAKTAFYLADNKVSVFSSNDGVLLNPYMKEDLSKIKKHLSNFNKNYDFTDKSTENINARYHVKEAIKDPSIPQEIRDSFNNREIEEFKAKNPEFIAQLKDSSEWKPIPLEVDELANNTMLETLGYETKYKQIEGTNDYGYHYRRVS